MNRKSNTALTHLVLGMAALLCAPAAAFAADTPLTQEQGSILWTLLGGMLVMFMQPGFALVECGLTRAKNAANIMLKNYADFMLGSILYFLAGFAIMFGSSQSGLIGWSHFGMNGFSGGNAAGQWAWTFWFFQTAFAATAATIVSGAVAERTNFKAYMLVSVCITLFVYPVSGHWCWNSLFGEGQGWLEALGFIDFAGSAVVHSVGGWIALAGAIILGPRLGKYGRDGTARAIPGHNIPMAGLGVFILWFAWFGFNCCSTTAVDGAIGYIAANTLLSSCAGAVTAMLAMWVKLRKADPSMTLNGCLAGLVGVTAGCFEVEPLGALCIGAMAGVLVVVSVLTLDQVFRVDDPVGAISVHGVCGSFGTLMVGLFAAPGYGRVTGLLYGGGLRPLLVQALGALSVALWAFCMGFIIFRLVNCVIPLRVCKEEERKGLDIVEHGADAYSGFQIFFYD